MPSKSVENLLKEKKIYQIINQRLTKTSPDTATLDVIKLMQENRSGYCVVEKDKKVVGIFTEVDLVRRVFDKDGTMYKPISEFMTKEVKMLTPEDSIGDAIDLMEKNRFYHIPLVDSNKELVGILSVRTLIRFLAAYYPTEIYNLPPNPNQIMGTAEGG